MPARPFTFSEISTLESHLLAQGRFRDRMLLIAGTNIGYRITELLTWTVGQFLTREGEVPREVTVTRAHLKGGSGVHKRSVRVPARSGRGERSAITWLRSAASRRTMNSSSSPARAPTARSTARRRTGF